MAKAKLHMICGNCGCNDKFTFGVDYDTKDKTDKPLVFIFCHNCDTIHDLSDNAELEYSQNKENEE
jgi:RNase P subunit RPR2